MTSGGAGGGGPLARDGGGRDPTPEERACFEAGIKLGALYHQFVGAPISNDSAPTVAEAIAASVGEQRYVEDVDVDVGDVDENRFGYAELAGADLDVALTVATDGARVAASLAEEDGYPMMRIDGVE